MSAIELTDLNFESTIANAPADMPVLVECWAEWCAVCKLLLPTIHDMAGELEGRAVIGTLNVDTNPLTSSRIGVRSMPTILVYKGGKVVNQLFNMQTKAGLLNAMGLPPMPSRPATPPPAPPRPPMPGPGAPQFGRPF